MSLQKFLFYVKINVKGYDEMNSKSQNNDKK